MKVGIGLDNVLCKTTELFNLWKPRLKINADSYTDTNLAKEEAFWGALRPYEDLPMLVESVSKLGIDLFVLTERPSQLRYITRAWLRAQGLNIELDNIVCHSVKRYDCRLLRLDRYIDTDPEILDKFIYEPAMPVLLDRNNNLDYAEHILKITSLGEALQDANRMHVPWRYNEMPTDGLS